MVALDDVALITTREERQCHFLAGPGPFPPPQQLLISRWRAADEAKAACLIRSFVRVVRRHTHRIHMIYLPTPYVPPQIHGSILCTHILNTYLVYYTCHVCMPTV